MIKYRPHRGTLEDSMKGRKEFATMDALKEYLVSDLANSIPGISKERIFIGDDEGPDERIGWNETKPVLVKMSQFPNQPVQMTIVGMCCEETGIGGGMSFSNKRTSINKRIKLYHPYLKN